MTAASRESAVAEALWLHDGYDLDADPNGSTARELRPVYMARAAAVLAALDQPALGADEALAEAQRRISGWRDQCLPNHERVRGLSDALHLIDMYAATLTPTAATQTAAAREDTDTEIQEPPC